MAPEPTRYRFGPIEPGCAVGGLSRSQITCVALGLVGLVSVKQRWRTTWGAVSGARV